jgi:hypothetical protein
MEVPTLNVLLTLQTQFDVLVTSDKNLRSSGYGMRRRRFSLCISFSDAINGDLKLHRHPMVNQRHCPFCKTPALSGCAHLALAVPGRDFVRRCVSRCQGHQQWQMVCRQAQEQRRFSGEWSPDREDFTWLETAFCQRFLKHLRWFAGMDHEWRGSSSPELGGFWVLVWSKDPQRLWWELLDEFERQIAQFQSFPIYLAPARPQVRPRAE